MKTGESDEFVGQPVIDELRDEYISIYICVCVCVLREKARVIFLGMRKIHSQCRDMVSVVM